MSEVLKKFVEEKKMLYKVKLATDEIIKIVTSEAHKVAKNNVACLSDKQVEDIIKNADKLAKEKQKAEKPKATKEAKADEIEDLFELEKVETKKEKIEQQSLWED